MPELVDPGTINELFDDARANGYPASVRLIRDWTEAGLLDYPERRPAGRGKGSRQALYSRQQRHLLLVLLHHRKTNGIRTLARIPVGLWMYWGDEFVPLRQARRAMMTWLGDPRVSQREAKTAATNVLHQLDNPNATKVARRHLLQMLTDIAYTGKADVGLLGDAVRAVFEPSAGPLQRAVGHPAAPLIAESMIDLVRARVTAVDRLLAGDVTDAEFRSARHAHLVSYAEYAAQQPTFAAEAPPNNPGMYEAPTAQNALNECCVHLLAAIGLGTLYPEQAARIAEQAMPNISFTSANGAALRGFQP